MPALIVMQLAPELQNEESASEIRGPEDQKNIDLTLGLTWAFISPGGSPTLNQRSCCKVKEVSSSLTGKLETFPVIMISPGIISSPAETIMRMEASGDMVRYAQDLQTNSPDEGEQYANEKGRIVPGGKQLIEIPTYIPASKVRPILPNATEISVMALAKSLQRDDARSSLDYSPTLALSYARSSIQSSLPILSNALEIGSPKVVSVLKETAIDGGGCLASIDLARSANLSLAAADTLHEIVYSPVNYDLAGLLPYGMDLNRINIGSVPRTTESLLQNIFMLKEETSPGRKGGKTVSFHNTFNIQIHVDAGEERDLKDLGRKIGQILSDEIRQYGGIS